jgi:pyruvate formate lyase activating enzyme
MAYEEGRIRVNHQGCTGCGVCTAGCPGNALSLAGALRSLAEVTDVCLEDQVFYEESGGGVTLTGGEALSQKEFAESLLARLGEEGIHRTIETSGFAAPEVFNRIADKADLILFDIKHHRREKHRALTGAYNDRIINNLQSAFAQGRNVLPRIPVIPGCNNTLEDAAAFAELLFSIGAREVQLLPFHQFGQNKYRLLGLDYKLENTKAPHSDDLESFGAVFEAKGIRTV